MRRGNDRPNDPDDRAAGLDLLRTLCMCMVIVLHILGQGGILDAAAPGSASYYIAWSLECLCYCAADGYGLLSGYLSGNRRSILSRLALLWLEVALYSLAFAVFFWLRSPELVGKKEVLNALFPVLRRQYWYFTAYFGLSFLMPAIHAGLQYVPEKKAAAYALVLFTVFSVFPTLFCSDPFQFRGGYTTLWIVVLYLIGALLKRGEAQLRLASPVLCLALALCSFLTFGFTVFWSIPIQNIGAVYLLSYTSPTVLLSAICLLLLFGKVKGRHRAVRHILMKLSAASFGVYVLHTNPLVWKHWFRPGVLRELAFCPSWLLPAAVIGGAILIYLACFLVDSIRAQVFDSFGIRRRLEAWEKQLMLFFRKEN